MGLDLPPPPPLTGRLAAAATATETSAAKTAVDSGGVRPEPESVESQPLRDRDHETGGFVSVPGAPSSESTAVETRRSTPLPLAEDTEPEAVIPPPPPNRSGGGSGGSGNGKWLPPHLRNKQGGGGIGVGGGSSSGGKYVPPHLRNKQGGGGGKDGGGAPLGGRYVPPHLRSKPGSDAAPAPSPVRPPAYDDDIMFEMTVEDASPAREPPLIGHSNGFTIGDEGGATAAEPDSEGEKAREPQHFHLGGCADPTAAAGSILDPIFIPRKSSRVGKVRSEGYCGRGGRGRISADKSRTAKGVAVAVDGSGGGPTQCQRQRLRWEVGAKSECGIRDANEDSYLISNDLVDAFDALNWSRPEGKSDGRGEGEPAAGKGGVDGMDEKKSPFGGEQHHHHGLFAIFDGHCGNQAARYAAEMLPLFLMEEYRDSRRADVDADDPAVAGPVPSYSTSLDYGDMLARAITRLDGVFCRLCQEGGREWDCGATALVALVVGETVIIANLGDSRGVMCRRSSSKLGDDDGETNNTEGGGATKGNGWTLLDVEEDLGDAMDNNCGSDQTVSSSTSSVYWKEVAQIHCPARPDELTRIEASNGWITREVDMAIKVQLRRMDFSDQDVVDILKRCFADRIAPEGSVNKRSNSAEPGRIIDISRTCGELAVSRAIGDRDFKAAFNSSSSGTLSEGEGVGLSDSSSTEGYWECPFFLPYPEGHNQRFVGDLISGTPEIRVMRVGEEDDASEEFVLLACDGLWDVMDPDDAVRVTRGLLFDKGWSANKAVSALVVVCA